MKRTKIAASLLALVIGLGMATSCGSKETPAQKTIAPADSASVAGINIRYVDEDSLSAHYNLAKDFKEASIRAYSKLEDAQRSKGQEIQRLAQQIEDKAKSNGYLSEASYNADMQKLAKMQQDAQAYLARLEQTTQQELMQQQQQLQDSVLNYIKEYNLNYGYDAILLKAAGLYFNPALDITNDIIEGLNARYNKVAGKK